MKKIGQKNSFFKGFALFVTILALSFGFLSTSALNLSPAQAQFELPPPQGPPPDDTFDPLQGPTQATFDTINPLKVGGSPFADELTSPGAIVSRMLTFVFPLAGMIVFVMLVWGGFEVLMGALNKKSMEAGKQRITAALVGFLLLFSSYWIAQLIEWVFGITILG